MPTLERRVQLLLDPERYAALQQEAQATHRSVAAVIRESIDDHLGRGRSTRADAVRRLQDIADRNRDEPKLEWDDTVAELEQALAEKLR